MEKNRITVYGGKAYGVKVSDYDIVEFVESICGAKLLDWQKQYLREVQSKTEGFLPKRHGKSIFNMCARLDDSYTLDIFLKELTQNG